MLQEIMEDYNNGKLNKKQYSQRLFKMHEILIDYTKLLQSSIVQNIDIGKEEVIITINNYNHELKMKLNETDAGAVIVSILNNGNYEQEELEISLKIINMLEDNSVIFDVGANLGWYTINILKNIKNSMVYSFEPINKTCNQLKRNLELNGLMTQNIYNLGFYNDDKILEFFYNKIESGASSIIDIRQNELTEKVKCKVKKMDTFITDNNIKKLDFIKCDVEGSELFVYQGGLDTIKRFKPVIFSEMLRKWSAKFGYHPNKIIDFFSDIDYECFIIKNKQLKQIKTINENTIETNYFFLHQNKHRNIIKQLVY
ncbi:FkbM family methyltransferase [Vallitalea maricola]|uniref:Uncharacterized protein n=1 Tax=Vallitalea maricola TaxID=3074433 RepID=A0ACB5UKL2_9FIRM|nr:hypothetical protein AN2V17_25340 [Vallitalea sp. AN17-2]